MKNNLKIIFLLFFLFTITSCSSSDKSSQNNPPLEIENYIVEFVSQIPHNGDSFTEGLLYHQGKLYESTGLYGESSLQRLNAQTGAVEQYISMNKSVFAEGLTLYNGKLYQLTWREQKAFEYDFDTFEILNTFSYDTEGWGLTSDDENLIMSDGSDVIYFRDAQTFDIEKKVFVKKKGQPLYDLNELEYVNGYVYANIYKTNSIAKIDPKSGNVVGMIDATSLYQYLEPSSQTGVLNGIAHNPDTGHFYLTGKNWLSISEVKFVRSVE